MTRGGISLVRGDTEAANNGGKPVGAPGVIDLLEREQFLKALDEYAVEAREGHGRLVLISGEAGVGKSSLVEAFRRRLPESRWLAGACDGMFTPRPLGPLFDIAEAVGGELAAACATGVRERMFAAIRAIVAKPEQLTVVLIEDVHWADEATLDLLAYLARRLVDASALIVLTYRDEAIGPDTSLQTVLGHLATEPVTRRIMLPALTLAAVATLSANTRFEAAELLSLTGGNPFFVTEVLSAGSDVVPGSARDAVIARSARLSAAARTTLLTAALLGSQVETQILREVAGSDAATIDECIASGLLSAAGSWLQFRHEIARVALEQSLPPQLAIETHAAILAALLAASCEDVSRLTHHAELAGDAARVLEFAPQAAQRAAALAAHREAVSLYACAINYVDRLDTRQAAELYDAYATELTCTDQFEDSAAVREQALERWRRLGEPLRVGHALLRLSGTMWRMCRGDECLALSEAAVAELEKYPPSRELAMACANLASDRGVKGDFDSAAELLSRALVIAKAFDMVELSCQVTAHQGLLAISMGGDGMPELKAALDIALEHDLENSVGWIYTNLTEAPLLLRQLPEAEASYVAGLAYVEEHDLAVFSNCLRGGRTIGLALAGEFDAALDLARQLLDQPGLSPVNRLNPLGSLGRILARRGESSAARAALDEAVQNAIGVDVPEYVVTALLGRVEAVWLEAVDNATAIAAVVQAAGVLTTRDPWTRGSIAIWEHRLAIARSSDLPVAPPYQLEIDGDHAGAAAAWDALGCPYDAALALLGSDDEALLRDALSRLYDLGATATALMARRRLRAIGATVIPVGPRRSTSEHPVGLTKREQEILELLCEDLGNAEIAHQLVVSERTVEHHVSAIFRKLDVRSRRRAAQRARELGLVREAPRRASL